MTRTAKLACLSVLLAACGLGRTSAPRGDDPGDSLGESRMAGSGESERDLLARAEARRLENSGGVQYAAGAPSGGGAGGGPAKAHPFAPAGEEMSGEDARRAAEALVASTPEGDTLCEQAYAGLAHMVDAYRARTPSRQGETLDRDGFMRSCRLAPRALQQCMVPAYVARHLEECEAVRRNPTARFSLPDAEDPEAEGEGAAPDEAADQDEATTASAGAATAAEIPRGLPVRLERHQEAD